MEEEKEEEGVKIIPIEIALKELLEKDFLRDPRLEWPEYYKKNGSFILYGSKRTGLFLEGKSNLDFTFVVAPPRDNKDHEKNNKKDHEKKDSYNCIVISDVEKKDLLRKLQKLMQLRIAEINNNTTTEQEDQDQDQELHHVQHVRVGGGEGLFSNHFSHFANQPELHAFEKYNKLLYNNVNSKNIKNKASSYFYRLSYYFRDTKFDVSIQDHLGRLHTLLILDYFTIFPQLRLVARELLDFTNTNNSNDYEDDNFVNYSRSSSNGSGSRIHSSNSSPNNHSPNNHSPNNHSPNRSNGQNTNSYSSPSYYYNSSPIYPSTTSSIHYSPSLSLTTSKIYQSQSDIIMDAYHASGGNKGLHTTGNNRMGSVMNGSLNLPPPPNLPTVTPPPNLPTQPPPVSPPPVPSHLSLRPLN